MVELKKGARITGGDRSKLAADLKKQVLGRGQHPRAGGRDRPVLRVRAPHPGRVRCDAARSRRRNPRQEVLTRRAGARDGALATVSLDRPDKRNAQTPQMWRDLLGDRARPPRRRHRAGRGAARPRGRPSRPASTGRCSAAGTAATRLAALAGSRRRRSGRHDRRLPGGVHLVARRRGSCSIAAVQGHAVGAGFQLALACDLRVLAEDAQLSMRETSLGLVPDLAGTKPLVDAGRLLPRAGDLRDRPLGRRARRPCGSGWPASSYARGARRRRPRPGGGAARRARRRRRADQGAAARGGGPHLRRAARGRAGAPRPGRLRDLAAAAARMIAGWT